jgi:hypothetical protein
MEKIGEESTFLIGEFGRLQYSRPSYLHTILKPVDNAEKPTPVQKTAERYSKPILPAAMTLAQSRPNMTLLTRGL